MKFEALGLEEGIGRDLASGNANVYSLVESQRRPRKSSQEQLIIITANILTVLTMCQALF